MQRAAVYGALGLVLMVLCAPVALAEDDAEPTAKEETQLLPESGATFIAVDKNGGLIKPMRDGHGQAVWLLRKNVVVTNEYADGTKTVIRADNALVWVTEDTTPGDEPAAQTGDSPIKGKWHILAAYAEGDVVLERDGSLTRCDRLYFNLQDHRAIIFNGWIKLVNEEQAIAIYIRGNEIRQKARGKFELENGTVSTCPYGHPHFAFRTKSLVVTTRDFEGDSDASRQVTVVGKQGFLMLGNTPAFYFPQIHGGLRERYLVDSFRTGSSSRFGSFALTKWDMQELGILDNDWSRLLVRTDYYSERGFGYGLDFKYGTEKVAGDLELYQIKDEGKDRRNRVRVEPEVDHRGRIKWRHRQWLADDLFAILEVSKLSDRGFLNEYYEREFKDGKDQENVLYLRKISNNVMSTFTGKVRANNFLTQTEYLPQVGLNVFHAPIPRTGAYYSLDTELSQVRRRFDKDLGLSDHRVARFDVNNEVSRPITLGPVQVRPFLGARATALDNSVSDGGVVRFVATGGARVSTQWHRQYPVQFAPLKIDDIRHIFRPDVRLFSVFANSHRSSELLGNDAVEEVDRVTIIRFGLRNLFQTKRAVERLEKVGDNKVRRLKEHQTQTLLVADVEVDYYPDKDRDNPRGARHSRFLLTDAGGRGDGQSFSAISLDLHAYPSKALSFSTEIEYNSASGDIDESEVGAHYRGADSTRLSVTHSLVRNNGRSKFSSFTNIFPFNSSLESPVSTVGTAIGDESLRSIIRTRGGVDLGPKWAVDFVYEYDLRNRDLQSQEVVLRRWWHEWALDLSLERDGGDKETTFKVSLATGSLVKRRDQDDDEDENRRR